MYTPVSQFLPVFKGMADFQVLPPGLNQIPYKAETLDPKIFQISGMYDSCACKSSTWVCVHVHVDFFHLEPFDETLDGHNFPLFLPPWSFSKFEKPSSYA